MARCYAETQAAETARERIKALGGTLPDPADCQEIMPNPTRPRPTATYTRTPKKRYKSQAANIQAVNSALGQMVETARANDAANQAATMRRMTPQPVPSALRSQSHICGATTLTGAPCQRLVIGPGFCYQHQGY